MAALPRQEKTGLAHASRIPGKMPACGHDGHTALLLATAGALARSRTLGGTLHLIFRPAEEDRGGAQRMLDEGLLQQFQCDE